LSLRRILSTNWSATAGAGRDHSQYGRACYRDAQADIAELTERWHDAGYLPADADTKAVAATIFTLMHGLIVMHHLVDDVPSRRPAARGISARRSHR
jgi:hypothetical protein